MNIKPTLFALSFLSLAACIDEHEVDEFEALDADPALDPELDAPELDYPVLSPDQLPSEAALEAIDIAEGETPDWEALGIEVDANLGDQQATGGCDPDAWWYDYGSLVLSPYCGCTSQSDRRLYQQTRVCTDCYGCGIWTPQPIACKPC